MSWDPHRREVLRLIAAGAAASLAGCSKPDQPIVPAVHDADGDRAGRVRRYATTLALAGYGRGATALVVDGRPIKLEGSARHPASLGATDLFAEAAILDLYDPQRLRAPVGPGGVAGWDMLARSMLSHVAATGDGTGVVLLTGRVTSPTLLARIAEARTRLPGLRHVRAEAIDDDAERAGARLAFGRPLTMRPRFADADVVVVLDADPLGPGPDQIAWARAWADRRRVAGRVPLRTYVIEPSPTQSGVCADISAALHPALIPNVLLALAAGLGARAPSAPLPKEVAPIVTRALGDLRAAHGCGLVMVGRGQPAEAHALAAWINARLGAPIDWIAPIDPDPAGHIESLAGLTREMAAGRVSTLVVLDANPVHHAPPALGFAEALSRVPLSVAFAAFPDETAMLTRWRTPLAHSLESWGDLRASDGTASLVQPMIKPLFGGRSPLEAIAMIDAGGSAGGVYHRVRDQWRGQARSDPDRWWRDTLVAGVIDGTAANRVATPAPRLVLPRPTTPPAAMVVTLPPSATLWDGRGGTNAWAQECPDPITRQMWGAWLRLSPIDGERLHLRDGDEVAFNGVVVPVTLIAGQAAGVATLPLGHGRTAGGPIATSGGGNGFRLREATGGWVSAPVTPVATGKRARIPNNRVDFGLDGEPEKLFPVVSPGQAMRPSPPLPSLLGDPPPRLPAGLQWGMVIDASACIGCHACVVACQAENNVPAIGPDQIAVGRDMHWLRVDLYRHEAGGGFQPVPCMQCESAPCEPVCPVEASVHTADGLNSQVYNRCVGTRTCQANCPYKVRRFNYLDYGGEPLWGELDPASVSAQKNPDVTVRARGVMEKCTYCVQRIETAKQDADAYGTPLGKVTTACEAACPTRAISFGDIADAAQEVTKLRADSRHYALLEELGTRPRTTYLARIVNDGRPRRETGA